MMRNILHDSRFSFIYLPNFHNLIHAFSVLSICDCTCVHHKIPCVRHQDVQTLDIDYMNRQRDFTYDPIHWGDLPDLVQELHNDNIKVTIILVSISPSPPTAHPALTPHSFFSFLFTRFYFCITGPITLPMSILDSNEPRNGSKTCFISVFLQT